MTDKLPKISSLKPVVLRDKRRVTLEMVVDNLPTLFSNVSFTVPDLPDSLTPPKPEDPGAPSPYPNRELSIINSNGKPVANMLIVEHKENFTALTLHMRTPDTAGQYTARAEMSHHGEMLEVVDVPFTIDND